MPTIQTLAQNLGWQVAPAVLMLAAAAIGALSLLYGYRLVRMFIFLSGFFLGIALSAPFIDHAIVSLVIGLVVGLVAVALWKLGVFVVGCVLGALIAFAAQLEQPLLVGIVALVGGILAVAVQRFMLVVSTSWTGAYLIVGAAAMLIGCTNILLLLVGIVLLTVVGIICQYTVTSGDSKKDPGPETAEPAQGDAQS